MKKNILMSCSILLLCHSNLYGNDNGFYSIGASMNGATIKENNSTNTKYQIGATLAAGTIENNIFKYLSYNYVYNKDSVSYQSINLNYDKILLKENKLGIFAGLQTGIGTIRKNGQNDFIFEYGIKTGLSYKLDSKTNLFIEYKLTKPEDTTLGNDILLNRYDSFSIKFTRKFKHLMY